MLLIGFVARQQPTPAPLVPPRALRAPRLVVANLTGAVLPAGLGALPSIATLCLQHLVIVADGRAGERAERRRRDCLERMLYELDQLGVDTATFESRGPADDRRDRFMLDALRARKVVSPELRMAHIPGSKDPLLWVPDTVCGAVTHQRTGDPCT